MKSKKTITKTPNPKENKNLFSIFVLSNSKYPIANINITPKIKDSIQNIFL